MKSFAIPRFPVNDNGLKQNYSFLKRFFCNKAKEKPKSKEKWNAVVGLEIHAQIASKSKLFSGASTEYGKAANTCVAFFDCATPGTLPVLNRRCVEAGVLTALALSCKVNEISLFDRKHYFYADLPAGYQITQQRQPLAIDGELKFHVFTPGVHKEPYLKSSKLKQIQLEQDSGKSIHDELSKVSLIDLNRAGVPLMEFVFEPDLSDGEEAAALVKELMLILERLNTCSCRMDEGALRVDANVSINKPDEALGVRTEVKNIGSVRAVAAAVNYEIKRQIKARESGIKITNETRAWDSVNNKTVSMRDKEEKQDYRFMPEPNLPPLHIHVHKKFENKYNLVDAPSLQKQIPEMPEETRKKLATKFSVHKALILVLVNEPKLLELFTYIIKDEKRTPNLVAKTLLNQLLHFLYKNDLDFNYCTNIRDHLCELMDLLESGTINLLVFHRVLEEILKNPKDFPRQIVERNDWIQITDEAELRKICRDTLNEYPKEVELYKKGKHKLFRFFMNRIKKSTNEKANLGHVEKILKKMLDD
ncbi:glutamyl-tRNA(Gln) amidotransferase subunit B, mitochondrial [Nasonia vitripennis]|uniref:Glutamyl-tRNA(Gln) amidotransferase subunit B, mitochondrial n=1 Tax=Nasonia vitripennis TaxID=7425 RepID=A0A7M7G1P8_NASVI|nr:glutamyl-tRNA(Gln) amidotransferase subunit B, mitochondrial [Nasonia vitripennis]